MKKHILTFILLIFSLLFIFSCTPQKKLIYLQKTSQSNEFNNNANKYYSTYKIRPGDNLYIKFHSFDRKMASAFNPEDSYDDFGTQRAKTQINLYIDGYIVNDSGYVDLPVLGFVHVADSTLYNTKMFLQKEINKYLSNAYVIVKLLNFNITVLGEVKRPGTFNVYNERISILEALGNAGDLTDYGNRNILLVRNEGNSTKMARINLLEDNLVNSEYYYLMPNDVLYVEPYNAKRFGFLTFPFGTIISSITTLILVLNYFRIR